MKKSIFLFVSVLILLCVSCAKDQWPDPPPAGHGNNNSPDNLNFPAIRIAVISDIHYMHPSMAPDDPENNEGWQAMVTHDRKIFELSDPIFRKVFSALLKETPDILLITGDLAMEGQLVCHETVVDMLQELEERGVKVFVVPGNNDIDNPSSQNFKDIPPSPVPGVTEEDFTTLYGNFGYNEALYRDENSLSYICQPYDRLWIIGIDGVLRSDDGITGAINPLTLSWIQEKMIEANEKEIVVLPMMHYGILEHYSGQKYLEQLISSSRNNAEALMNSGIRLIFTGHYHANDIAQYSKDGKTLSDIQTGSLVTPPYSYRMLTLNSNVINGDIRRPETLAPEIMPEEFIGYSNEVFTQRINGFFTYYGSYLRGLYGIPAEQYPATVPFFTEAYKAYFAGDELLDPEEAEKIRVLGQTVPSALPLLNSLWNDLSQDSEFQIPLK